MKFRSIAAAFALVLIGVIAWGWTAPGRSLEELRAAARSGDQRRLEEIVDFPLLRDNAKADVDAALRTALGGEGDNPYGILGGYGERLAGAIINRLLTAETLAAFASGQATPDPGNAAADDLPDHDVEWSGPGSYRLVFDNEDEEDILFLEFARQGMRWRLVRLGIPQSAL